VHDLGDEAGPDQPDPDLHVPSQRRR
jgi:hypothetical protein